MKRIKLVLTVLALVALGSMTFADDDFPIIANNERDASAEPMPAGEAAARMRLPDGFRVSVFAAEPEVQNPIAMAWDTRGRMWVAENFTYSDRAQRFDLTLRDRVLIFEDRDNDGRADLRKVFTDSVQMLTSVEVGRGGVWLMCPPQLLFIPDADGDDIPDGPAQVVLDGFTVAQDNYHNFANGLRWGPDGWLYGRCGHSCPGRIGRPGTPDELRVPLDGGVWRFHPERKTVEVLCHGTVNPWGHDWDANGELFFINTVIGHVWHVIPGAHFKESYGESRNPNVYERMDTIADHFHFDKRGNWADSRDGAANDRGGGHAHIGMMIYQSDLWPEEYRHKLFTLNMHGRRANVDGLERRGAGFVARHEPDLFIADDPFFRGIEISGGPDGNVFVIDWSDTGECHEHTGVHRTSGRIYKISYGTPRSPAPLAKPACLDGAGPLPELWKQYQAGETTPDRLRALLQHSDEHVRAWAIRLLTDHWPLDTIVGPRPDAVYPQDPATRVELARMARNDESGLVLMVLASTLQRLPVEHRMELAVALAQRERFATDRDLPSLVWFGLIPLADRDPMQLAMFAQECRWPTTLRWVTRALASRMDTSSKPLDHLLASAGKRSPPLQDSVLSGLSEATRGWRVAPRPTNWLAFAQCDAAQARPDTVRELNAIFGDGRALDEIRAIALDPRADLKLRQSALTTLIDARPDDLRQVCQSLLRDRPLNGTAARGLALFDDPEVGRVLARGYSRFHADDRPYVLELLVSRPSFARALLDNVGDRNGQIKASHITAYHARQIRGLEVESLDRKLAEVWGELRVAPAERRQQIDQLREQLAPGTLRTADLGAGRLLFRKTCAACHLMYGDGTKIAPDLTGSQRANLDYLLENILDPSAVVGKDYRMTIVRTVDGQVLNGLVTSRDAKKLVLQTPTELRTIPLEDIEQARETTLSSMPDGLLAQLSPEQIRDLIAYLMHPGQVALPSSGQ